MREKLKEHTQGLAAGITLIFFALIIKLLSSQATAEKPKEGATPDPTPPFALCDASCFLMVPVKVDGKELLFEVDTGAQITIVNGDSLTLVPPHLGYCSLNSSLGATQHDCYLSTIGHVEVGGITAEKVNVAISPVQVWGSDRKVDGVLGIDFLRNYKVVLGKNTLQLYEAEGK